MATDVCYQTLDLLTTIRSDFEGCSQFNELRQVLLKSGRGRKKKLDVETLELNNKLLLQVYVLKEDGFKSWKEIENFFSEDLCRNDVPINRWRTLIEKTLKLLQKETHETLPAFLAKKVDVDGLSPHLSKYDGLTRSSLLKSNFKCKDSMPTNGTVVELGRFQNKHKLSNDILLGWFCRLTNVTAQLPPGTAVRFKKQVDEVTKSYLRMQSDQGKSNQKSSEFKLFVEAPFTIPGMFGECSTSRSSTDIEKPSTIVSIPLHELGGLQSHVTALRGQVEQSAKNKLSLQHQVDVLTSEKKASLKETQALICTNATLSQQLIDSKNQTANLQQRYGILEESIAEKNNLLKTLKKTNVIRRNRRLLTTIKQLKKTLQQTQMANQLKRRAKNKRDYVQKKLQQTIALKDKLKQQNSALEHENRLLRQRNAELEVVAEGRLIHLKDQETGFFTKEARLCIMELVGQHEISAGRVGQVIQTVCRKLLSAQVPENELPSERSVGRFVDMGQVLGKIQIADALTHSEYFDLHTDATTRVGKKYVGQQVTTADGQSLNCGYTVVATENADCLVNLAINQLEELAVIYEEDAGKQHEKFLEFMQKISGLMSDRAAVMKCFNERFNVVRKDLLQTTEDIDFLYCNAHFLLGLGSSVTKVFKEISDGVPVGRDTSSKFQGLEGGIKGEHPAIRYIREACSCLGPRGDERYGCRENWLAFCLLSDVRSGITSFKSNRFNNLFEASAALHFHQEHIETFFNLYMSDLNWKQDGILLDSKSTAIDNHLVALGLMFFRLTGPYWRLLGKPIHYLDFYSYVMEMMHFLQRWEMDPHDAFDVDFTRLFGIDMGYNRDPAFRSLVTVPEDQKIWITGILKSVSSGFLKVLRDQLKNFLPGEKYHNINDPELRHKLQHCHLTNIIGEQCFGDLDFSMFKRRNASTHCHSSINMLKRNHTLTTWFISLTSEEQKAALARASALRLKLRKAKRLEEKNALTRRRELLLENRAKRLAQEEKKRQKKISIIHQLRQHAGPCTNAEDVCHLITAYHTKTDRTKAVKAELQYHKVILGQKSPLLAVTKKPAQLLANLREFLGIPHDAESDHENEEGTDAAHNGPRRKRRRTTQNDDSSSSCQSCSSSEKEEEFQSEEEEPVTEIPDFNFSFQDKRLGSLVAVGYEDDLYIGEIQEICSDSSAVINFLSQCKAKGRVFRWPSIPDSANVDAKFVVASDFNMTTTTGRFWMLSEDHYKSITAKYRAFKYLYF